MDMTEECCKIDQHDNNKLLMLRTDVGNHNGYKVCAKCITSQQMNGGNIINLKELYSENALLIMDNWPLFSKESQIIIQNKLKDIVKISSTFYSDIVEDINSFYTKLSADLQKQINESQKAMLIMAEKYKEFQANTLEIYHNLQEKQEFQQLIKELTNESSNEQSNPQIELENFLIQMDQNREKNTILINDQIDEFHNQKMKYTKAQAEQISQYSLKLIQEIHFFSPPQNEIFDKCKLFVPLDNKSCTQQDQQQQIISNLSHNQQRQIFAQKLEFSSEQQQLVQQQQKQQVDKQLGQQLLQDKEEIMERKKDDKVELEEEKNESIKKILRLVGNKSNFCSQRFLSEFENFLKKTPREVFSLVDFNRVQFEEELQPIDFSRVSLISLKQMIERDDSESKMASRRFDEKVQSCLLRNIYLQSKIIKGEPIFVKTHYETSQNSIIITPTSDCIQIQKIDQSNKSVQAVTSFNINPDFMYVFRYTLVHKQSEGHYLYAGLIKETNIDTHRIQQEHKYQGSYYENCFTQSHPKSPDLQYLLFKDQKEIRYNTFEMRIHLSKNIIQLMDYPSYNHTFTLDPNDMLTEINPHEKYRFGFEFYAPQGGEQLEIFFFDVIYQN